MDWYALRKTSYWNSRNERPLCCANNVYNCTRIEPAERPPKFDCGAIRKLVGPNGSLVDCCVMTNSPPVVPTSKSVLGDSQVTLLIWSLSTSAVSAERSEERRVGKECRSRWS